ncbi:hydrogenase expression/formation protein [Acidocella sp.]|uniref:hydrogenase expression/formation protein n=1 Tax=Acidocella sp. TaxID=50710 RepID=UPI002614A3D5|nr:hydrogenase expression/formation protein [Acidocella sp.]
MPLPNNQEPSPDYMMLPQAVNQYLPPRLPEDPALRAAGGVWLERIEAALAAYAPDSPDNLLDLREAPPEAVKFLNETLGSGEVSALAFGTPDLQIEETVFTGLWRVRGEGVDYLEIGDVPAVLKARARAGVPPMPALENVPAEVVNAPHLLAEIHARARTFAETGAGHNFNLDLLPLTDADLGWLVKTLGEGAVVIVSSGYGACRIRSTHLGHVWWVQFSNAANALILNSIDIGLMPSVACAAADDIADSARRVRAVRSVYA